MGPQKTLEDHRVTLKKTLEYHETMRRTLFCKYKGICEQTQFQGPVYVNR